MASIRVTVAPVAMRPLSEDPQSTQLRVSTLRPDGEWPSATVPDPGNALQVARELLEREVRPELRAALRLENVGVDYAAGVPNLMLTAVLPIAAAELRDAPQDWQLLTPWVDSDSKRMQLLSEDPVRAAMVVYWRGQLGRTSASLDFLPKHFTIAQVRSVYASVWGEVQAHGNFQRWLLDSARDVSDSPLLKKVGEEEVRQEVQSGLAVGLTALGMTLGGVRKAWGDSKIVGASASVVGARGLATLPAVALAGAIVGGTIAWQRAANTGRPPIWYTRRIDDRVDLKTSYPVRPPAPASVPTFLDA